MSELHRKFGDLLKLERERQEITLADISDELKIPESTLLCIESGDLGALPSELYFKLFARSYGEHLGIDYDKTVEAIREELGEAIEPLDINSRHQGGAAATHRRAEKVRSEGNGEPDLSGIVKRVGILAGLVVAAFIVVLVGYKMFFADDGGTTEADAVTEELTDATAVVPADQREVAADYNWDLPAYHPPDSIQLRLVPREDSWATVLADGDTAIYYTLRPGREYAVTAKYRLRVSIAVPRVVDVNLDGRPAFLASGETGRISRVEIDQTNRHKFGEPPRRSVPVRAKPADPAAQPPVDDDTQRNNETEAR
jgi:transcriptional regulator with XRE-family HTH domain